MSDQPAQATGRGEGWESSNPGMAAMNAAEATLKRAGYHQSHCAQHAAAIAHGIRAYMEAESRASQPAESGPIELLIEAVAAYAKARDAGADPSERMRLSYQMTDVLKQVSAARKRTTEAASGGGEGAEVSPVDVGSAVISVLLKRRGFEVWWSDVRVADADEIRGEIGRAALTQGKAERAH